MHVPQRLMLRGIGIFVVLVAVGAALSFLPPRARASRSTAPWTGTAGVISNLRTSLDAKAGELELKDIELKRARDIIGYSTRFQIPADLATLIYDEALAAGLDPGLGFEIVRIESRFNPQAVSRVGALGLTQIMPATAAFYDSGRTVQELLEPRTNLRVGFHFFRDLLERFNGDLRMALLAYNRGPGRVNDLVARGQNPANGYGQAVIMGYKMGGAPPQ
jgi:soluble lytic murein transglycosylase-like protein